MSHEIIDELCAQLADLARSRPNRPGRAMAISCLDSKWEGVQVHAGRALGAWGDAESVAALRSWVERCLQKEAGWSVLGEAAACMASHVSPQHVQWALDLYFGEDDRVKRHSLLALLEHVPRSTLAARADVERASGCARREEAAEVAKRRFGLNGAGG
jgi:hypothetical protein